MGAADATRRGCVTRVAAAARVHGFGGLQPRLCTLRPAGPLGPEEAGCFLARVLKTPEGRSSRPTPVWHPLQIVSSQSSTTPFLVSGIEAHFPFLVSHEGCQALQPAVHGRPPTPSPASVQSTDGLIPFASPPGSARKKQIPPGRFFLGLRMEASDLLLPVHLWSQDSNVTPSSVGHYPMNNKQATVRLTLGDTQKGPTL